MSKLINLEEFMKQYISTKGVSNKADSYLDFKRKNNYTYERSYAKAIDGLYSTAIKNSMAYGNNYSNLANKGLQNSGYAAYVDAKSKQNYASSLNSLNEKRSSEENRAMTDYISYLDNYKRRNDALKRSVSSYLIKNNVANLNTAISYGVSAGLDIEDATAVGNSVYAVTKQRVFLDILKQSSNLGLDKNGAIKLALEMGFSSDDANEIGDKVEEMMRDYGGASDSYLDYLEQKSHSSTKTFN